MMFNNKRRLLGTFYKRAPNVLWALGLLVILGMLLGFHELRSMALERNALTRGSAKCQASTNVVRASLECRRCEKELLLHNGDLETRSLYFDQLHESWKQLLTATQALRACLPPDDPRMSMLAVERLEPFRQQFVGVPNAGQPGESALADVVQAMPAREKELQALSPVADELAAESNRQLLGARSNLIATTATSIAMILSMALIPGALILSGGYRLVSDCRDSEARLQAAFNFSFHPMIVTDPKGTIESASQSVKSVFGWEPHEIVGQNVTILMPASFRREHDGKVAAHLATGRETLIGKPRELQAVRRDGTPFPCIVTLWKAPLPCKDSYVLMAIISDITEQKANEAKIAELNQQVIVGARQAGKAEIATNVLHNVGNVLSSVNVASSLIRETLQSACFQDMQRVSSLLEEHASDLATFIATDPRGGHLPRFLTGLFRQLGQQRDAMGAELLALEKSIEHIKGIVESQQQYAKGISSVIEPIDVSDVVADAVRISEASLAHQGITVEVYSPPMPMVLLDEQKFLHVMVNLIGNARHACMESEAVDKWVKIWVQHDDGHVSVKIQDNGVGIDPAVQKRIFNHGFTTRKGGHGFGLHSVALAIEESCGSIEVHSAGVGEGATFFIRIPVVMATEAPREKSVSLAWMREGH